MDEDGNSPVQTPLVSFGRFFRDSLQIHYPCFNSIEESLSPGGLRIVLHERLHFFQTACTTLGIRSFVGELDRILALFGIISRRTSKGETVHLPVTRWLQESPEADKDHFSGSLRVWKHQHDLIYCAPSLTHPRNEKLKDSRTSLGFILTEPLGVSGVSLEIPILRIYADADVGHSLVVGEGLLRQAMATLFQLDYERNYHSLEALVESNFTDRDDYVLTHDLLPLKYCLERAPRMSPRLLKLIFLYTFYFQIDILPTGVSLYAHSEKDFLAKTEASVLGDILPGKIFFDLIHAAIEVTVSCHDDMDDDSAVLDKVCKRIGFPQLNRVIKLSQDYFADGLQFLGDHYNQTITGEVMIPLLEEAVRIAGKFLSSPVRFAYELDQLVLDDEQMVVPLEIYGKQAVIWRRSVPSLHYFIANLFVDLAEGRPISCLADKRGWCLPGGEAFFTPGFPKPESRDTSKRNDVFLCCCPDFATMVSNLLGPLEFIRWQ